MFIRIDREKNEAIVVKIGDMDAVSYFVMSHNKNFHLMNDDDIKRHGFKKIWSAELDEAMTRGLVPN